MLEGSINHTDDCTVEDDLALFDWLKDVLFKTEAALPARYLINTFQNSGDDDYPGLEASISGIKLEDIKSAPEIISCLESEPGQTVATEPIDFVGPDIYASKVHGKWVITPNEEGIPKLRISDLYREALAGIKGESKSYLKEKLRDAAWLVKSIQIRQEILVILTRQLLEFQNDALIDQSAQPRPKGLTTVAKSTGLHPSVVSCITQNKVIGLQESTVSFSSLLTS